MANTVSKMENLLFYDVLTTGSRYWKSGIYQIVGYLVSGKKKPVKIWLKFRPNERAVYDEDKQHLKAIVDKEKTTMQQAYTTLTKILSDHINKWDTREHFTLIGFDNASHKDHFLKAFFKQCGDSNFAGWFGSDTIDIKTLATWKMVKDKSSFKTITIDAAKEFFEIPVLPDYSSNPLYVPFICQTIYNIINNKII